MVPVSGPEHAPGDVLQPRDVVTALRLRQDSRALAASPLVRLRAVQHRAVGQFAGREDAGGLALQEALDEALAALAAELATRTYPGYRHDRADFAVLSRGGATAETARALGIERNTNHYRMLAAVRVRLVQRLLWYLATKSPAAQGIRMAPASA